MVFNIPREVFNMTKRQFGSIVYKPNKQHPTRIVASFPTPIEAFNRWPNLPLRISKSFTPSEEAEASVWLKRQELLIQAGNWEPETISRQKQTADRITFREYWTRWIEQRRTKTGKPLAPQTKYRMIEDAQNHLLPYFGATKLINIDQNAINQWLDQLPANQEAMRANVLKLLLAILRTAASKGPHGEPPLIPTMPYTTPIQKPTKRHETQPATPQQIHTIYTHMPPKYALAIYLAVFCRGLRISEVCALQRKHINLTTGTLHIRQARLTSAEHMIGPTKTDGSNRDEIIPKTLKPIIEQHLEHIPDSPDAWIFPSIQNPDAPIHPNSLRSWYATARQAAGRPDLRFHDLRHTALTWLAQDGATLKELMASAGHTTTENALRYQHAATERDQQLADTLGARLIDHTPDAIRARINDINEQITALQDTRAKLETELATITQQDNE